MDTHKDTGTSFSEDTAEASLGHRGVDPITIDEMVLSSEASIFIRPLAGQDMGDSDEEFWDRLGEAVSSDIGGEVEK